MGLVVGAAALNTFRLGLNDSGRVLCRVDSCVGGGRVRSFDRDMGCLEHQAVGRHQLRELVGSMLTAALIDLNLAATGRYASTRLILLVKPSA